MSARFCDLRYPQLKQLVEQNALVLLPVGQTEEHGPWLPVGTDSIIAEEVADATADRLEGDPPCVVMDPVVYGYSGRVMSQWPGTIRLRMDTLMAVVRETTASLVEMGFRKIIIVSIHGHHAGAVRVVVRQLADECDVDVAAAFPAAMVAKTLQEVSKAGPGASSHAGEFETSLMLHLRPNLVDMSAATDVDRLTIDTEFSSSEVFWSTWRRQRTNTGAYGAPTQASAETGRVLFDAMVERLAAFARKYHQHSLKA